MKILLILLAIVRFSASYESTEVYRGADLVKIHQNAPPNAFVPVTSARSYQPPPNHQFREYRRFGKDVLPTSTKAGFSATDFKENEKNIQKLNTEVQELISDNNPLTTFTPGTSNEQPLSQRSIFQQQNWRRDPSSDDLQMRFQRKENVADRSPVLAVHTSQDLVQNQAPLSVQHRSEMGIMGDLPNSFGRRLTNAGDQSQFTGREEYYRSNRNQKSQEQRSFHQDDAKVDSDIKFQNSFAERLPNDHDQSRFSGREEYQTRDDYRSSKNQKSLEHGISYQVDVRRDHDANQNGHFAQIPSFGSQDQLLSSSQAAQGKANQYQKLNQQNRKSSHSFPEGSFSFQGQAAFDSKRISSAAVGEPSQFNPVEQRTQSSTRDEFQSNQPERLLNRPTNVIGDDQKRNAVIKNLNQNHQQTFTQNDYQRLFQSMGKSQGMFTATKTNQPHSTSLLISGGRTASNLPIMMYNTENIASPHAIVLDKSSRIINKASITQHLQTPYAQYMYTHPL